MPISTIGSNSLNTTSDLVINGQTVGKGGGNVATNTAHGVSALNSNTTGSSQTAVGYQSLYTNTTNGSNTAIGYQSAHLSTGQLNVAVGALSLYNNTADSNNAFGYNSLNKTTSGGSNSAFGHASAYNNTTGSSNVAVGHTALFSNTTASNNTAVGYQAGYTNIVGAGNVFLGNQTGYSNTASNNTFLGNSAGYAVTSGAKNTIIGQYNGNQGGLDIRTASNRIVLSDGDGNPRLYADNNGAWQSTSAVGNNTLYPAFFCRAWVWFNGADASIFGSGNVSSVTRLANGSYTVNFTTAFPDNLYTGVTGFSRIDASAQFVNLGFSRTSSTDRVETFVGGGNAALSTIQIAYFR